MQMERMVVEVGSSEGGDEAARASHFIAHAAIRIILAGYIWFNKCLLVFSKIKHGTNTVFLICIVVIVVK